MTITPEQLAEWRRLAEAATPGEWTKSTANHLYFEAANERIRLGGLRWAKDVAFIAAAREAVPALLEEVARLSKERCFGCDTIETEKKLLVAERDTARAKLSALEDAHRQYAENLDAALSDAQLRIGELEAAAAHTERERDTARETADAQCRARKHERDALERIAAGAGHPWCNVAKDALAGTMPPVRCSCSHEAGDSECAMHPSDPETGEPIGDWRDR